MGRDLEVAGSYYRAWQNVLAINRNRNEPRQLFDIFLGREMLTPAGWANFTCNQLAAVRRPELNAYLAALNAVC
jgi:hypothetical protein